MFVRHHKYLKLESVADLGIEAIVLVSIGYQLVISNIHKTLLIAYHNAETAELSSNTYIDSRIKLLEAASAVGVNATISYAQIIE